MYICTVPTPHKLTRYLAGLLSKAHPTYADVSLSSTLESIHQQQLYELTPQLGISTPSVKGNVRDKFDEPENLSLTVPSRDGSTV